MRLPLKLDPVRPASLAATLLIIVAAGCAAQNSPPAGSDNALEAAREHVEKSDRYLHHSKLRRGMKGYGLSVFAETKIERFDVEIVSVVTNWGPHQDVILARLSGKGLEKSGVIAGMSGSPVYMRDEDGKDKIIGAVAYGWPLGKDPICGIQPITQMLAASGMFQLDKAQPAGEAAKTMQAGPASRERLQALLDPRKLDFAVPRTGGGDAEDASANAAPQLSPLVTPLMGSGMGPRTLGLARGILEPMGLAPMQGGAVGAADLERAGEAKLEPGASISVMLVTGDAAISAVGTVTDVVDGRVLGFGHSFLGRGEVDFPMGPSHVHTVIPSLVKSFKLASLVRVTGALRRDENVGVTGIVGRESKMIPMTVTIDWPEGERRRVYRYGVCRDRTLTPFATMMLIYQSTVGWHDLPEEHTIRYKTSVDFGELGRYEAQNVLAGMGLSGVISDTVRPMAALLDNPFGPTAKVERIDVEITVEPERLSAEILEVKLDGELYRPGDTITGQVTVRPFREERRKIAFALRVPEELSDGQHTLNACDWETSLNLDRNDSPQLFDPKTTGQLFAALRRVVAPRTDRVYLRLPLKSPGLALGQRELVDLPESKAGILADAQLLDAHVTGQSKVETLPSRWVLSGSAEAKFEVQRRPSETLLRDQRNPKP